MSWTNLRRNKNGEMIGRATGINYDQIGPQFHQVAEAFKRVEKVKQYLEKICKKNPNGLPF